MKQDQIGPGDDDYGTRTKIEFKEVMTTADRLAKIEVVFDLCRGLRVNLDINECRWMVERLRKLEAVRGAASAHIEASSALRVVNGLILCDKTDAKERLKKALEKCE